MTDIGNQTHVSRRRGASTIRKRSPFKRKVAACAGGAAVFFLLAGTLAWFSFRPTLAKAERLLAANRFEQAAAMFASLADNGDQTAKKRLAALYLNGGASLRPDADKALPLLLELDAAGDKDARVMLAGMYYRGVLGKSEYDRAAQLLLPFEHSDNGEALSLLGQAYYHGRGVPQNADAAYRLLGHAAALGAREGNAFLGMLMYERSGAAEREKSLELMRSLPVGGDRKIDLTLGKEYYRRRDDPTLAAEALARLRAGGAEEDAEASYFLGMLYMGNGSIGNENEATARGGSGETENGGNSGSGNFQQAEKYLTIAANGGIVDAALELAGLFSRAVPQPDYQRARVFLERAAAAGDLRAEAELGRMDDAGLGGPRDPAGAVKHLERAAAGEHAAAICRILWRLYSEGDGVTRDPVRAAAHLAHIAATGDAEAQTTLAHLSYFGRGVPVDYARAAELLNAGLDANIPAALSLRGWMYCHGDGGPLDEMRGLELIDRAAAMGDPAAADMRHSEIYEKTRLLHVARIAAAVLRDTEVGTALSGDKAPALFALYRKESLNGDAAAQGVLAALYVLGRGVGADYAEAALWARTSAENDDGFGQLLLGLLHFWGKGVPRRHGEAMKWLRRSAGDGFPDGQTVLGVCFYHGYGVRRDPEEAVRWFARAAMQGNHQAQAWMARCSMEGRGATRDREQALRWARLAAAGGEAEGERLLGELTGNARDAEAPRADGENPGKAAGPAAANRTEKQPTQPPAPIPENPRSAAP